MFKHTITRITSSMAIAVFVLTQCGLSFAAPVYKDRMQNLRAKATGEDRDSKVASAVGSDLRLAMAPLQAVFEPIVDGVKGLTISSPAAGADANAASRPRDDAQINKLIKELEDEDYFVIGKAAIALGGYGPGAASAVPALIKALTDEDSDVRKAVIITLGRIGPVAKDAVPALTKALTDEDSDVRNAAAITLGEIGPAASPAVDELIKVLNSEDSDFRMAAVIALGKIGFATEPVVGALIKALKDNDISVRRTAGIALSKVVLLGRVSGRISPGAVLALTNALTDEDSFVRRKIVIALSHASLAAIHAVPALTNLLTDEDRDVRKATAITLGDIGPAAAPAVPALTNALTDEDSGVCISAAIALGEIGPAAAPAIETLKRMLNNEEEDDISMAADIALRNIGPAVKQPPSEGRAAGERTKEQVKQELDDLKKWLQVLANIEADLVLKAYSKHGTNVGVIKTKMAQRSLKDVQKEISKLVDKEKGMEAELRNFAQPVTAAAVKIKPAMISVLLITDQPISAKIEKVIQENKAQNGQIEVVVLSPDGSLEDAQKLIEAKDRNFDRVVIYLVNPASSEIIKSLGDIEPEVVNDEQGLINLLTSL